MGTADRDYWRESDPAGPRLNFQLPPVSRVLFFTLIGCFAAQSINDTYGSGAVLRYLVLTGQGIRSGWLWQLLTFQFLHDGIMHLLVNLLAVWMLCPAVENILGRTRFMVAYLGSGIAGGVLQSALQLSFPSHFGPVVGASAGLEGIFAIYVLLHRDAIFTFMFVLPVRALTLYYVVGLISVFFTLVPSGRGGNLAHAAHLGGLIFGTLWVRQGWHDDFRSIPGTGLVERFTTLFRRRPRLPKRMPGTAPSRNAPRPTPRSQTAPPAATSRAGDLSAEADPILDKIAKHGMHSLTSGERQKLDEIHRRMRGQ